MNYKDRLMGIRRNSSNSPPAGTCAPSECGQMFGIIAEGLDDLKSDVAEARKDIGAVNERIAAQEAKTHSAWHSISRIEKRMNLVPRENAESIARHEAACPGRDYARIKLAKTTTSSEIPRPAREDETGRISQPSFALALGDTTVNGLQVPKWVVYIGVAIGVAIAASGYILNALGILSG